MFELKAISKDGIPAALAKVERYRLLNEPWEAESICLDILAVEPDNQPAIIGLILARTDQFGIDRGATPIDAREALTKLDDKYLRLYYAGIICERQAGSHLSRQAMGYGPIAYDFLRQAMDFYEQAEKIRPPANYDTIIRWNTCARAIMRHDRVRPAGHDRVEYTLE